jgi:hypothetical protein
MISLRLFICVMVALLGLQAVPLSARAGDLTAPDGPISISTDEYRVPDSAAAPQSKEEDTSRLSDLESAAARRSGPPAVSLSVSGWVAEQIIAH